MNGASRVRRMATMAAVGVTASLLLTGCAGTRFMSAAPEVVPIEVERDHATVVFLRPSAYGGAARFFLVDGRGNYLGDVLGREYFVHRFEPGTYEFVAWAENSELLKADLAAGKIYYVLLSVRMGMWTARMSISALTPNREEWPKLGEWMAVSRPLVADMVRAEAWQAAEAEGIQKRIAAARGAWDRMDETKRALRRLTPADGFDAPQH